MLRNKYIKMTHHRETVEAVCVNISMELFVLNAAGCSVLYWRLANTTNQSTLSFLNYNSNVIGDSRNGRVPSHDSHYFTIVFFQHSVQTDANYNTPASTPSRPFRHAI